LQVCGLHADGRVECWGDHCAVDGHPSSIAISSSSSLRAVCSSVN
jgi:hypothetical protein